jgi:hypothetical protein
MFILGIATLSDLVEIIEFTYEGFPFFHFTIKFILNLNFFVMMLQVLSAALHTEKLLVTVWTSFHIAVVDLNRITATIALDIVLGCPVI